MINFRNGLSVFTLSLFILSLSCVSPTTSKNDKNTGATNSVSLSGTLKHGLGKAKAGMDAADSILAVSLSPGQSTPDFFKAEHAVINADGSFKIELNRSIKEPTGKETPLDWVILLIDSKAETRFDKVLGFLSLNEMDQTLIKFPIAKTRQDSINMGMVTPSGNEARSDSGKTNYDTATFDLTVTQLKQMAQTGRTLKIIKNMYAAWEPIDQKGGLDIRSSYTIGLPHMAQAKDRELMPEEYLDTSKFSFSFQLFSNNQSVFNWQNLANRSTTIDLYPPPATFLINIVNDLPYLAEVTSFVSTDSSLNPSIVIDTNGNTAPVRSMALDDGNGVFRTILFPGFKGISKNGVWTLKENKSTVLTRFDMGLGNPFDTVTGKPFIYVPSINIATNAADTTIQQITVKWYYWDSQAGAYAQATDETLIQNAITSFEMSFTDASAGTVNDRESYAFGMGGNTTPVPVVITFTPAKKWVYAEPAVYDEKRVFLLNYSTGGQNFNIRIEGHKVTHD